MKKQIIHPGVNRMNDFINWWHTKVQGPYITNEQYDRVLQKMISNE